MVKWRRLLDRGGHRWWKSTDGRWEIRRRTEIIYRRIPVGVDNAAEPVTDWVSPRDAQHLGAELEARYPKPTRLRKPRSKPAGKAPRFKQARGATVRGTCRRCKKPIYLDPERIWLHTHGDSWIRPHDAEPKTLKLKEP